MSQLNLINLSDYGKPTKKRVHYKQPTFTKSYSNDIIDGQIKNDVCLWGRIKHLQSMLSNFFPFPLFNNEQYHDYGLVRVWKTNYTKDAYTYRGQIFQGQEFTVTEAEIIGTEDLYAEDRLKILEIVIERLENNEKEPFLNIDTMIKELKNAD